MILGGGDFKSLYMDVWAGVLATYPLWSMLKTIKYPHNGVVTGLTDTYICERFQARSYQVRANVYILGRSPVGVHSISMDQSYSMDRPEKMG